MSECDLSFSLFLQILLILLFYFLSFLYFITKIYQTCSSKETSVIGHFFSDADKAVPPVSDVFVQWFSTFSLHWANCRGTDATAGHELPALADYYNLV